MADYYGSSSGAAGATTNAGSASYGGVSVPGSSLAHSDSCKIFAGGLSWQTTEESLRWHFEQYGPVVSVEVMRDRKTGDPRGFAFVVFSESATVDLVMIDKDKHEINHKLVDVKRAQARGVAPPSIHERQMAAAAAAAARAFPPGGHNPVSLGSESAVTSGLATAMGAVGDSYQGEAVNAMHNGSSSGGDAEKTPEQMCCKLFVGGIPPQVDRDELKTIFEQFGTVLDAIVMIDQVTQRSRCFGFVTFDQVDGPNAAQRAIQAQPLSIHGRSVEVKLATPRSEQQGGAAGGGAGMGGGPPTGGGIMKRALPPGPKHLGLRAGQASATSATGEFAGLAVAYGRAGWKAGYGTKAFGKAGWNVWEDTFGPVADKAGFSFSMLRVPVKVENEDIMGPPIKRSRF